MTTLPFNTVDIINQIRNETKIFKFVAGAADLARIIDMENITPKMMPACFVVLKDVSYTSNESYNGIWQIETNYFDCVVIIDNTKNEQDLSGQSGYVDFSKICFPDLKKCLLNWKPPFNSPEPISLESCALDTMTTSRIIYNVTFKCVVNISSDDGYISPQYPDWTIESEISGNTLVGINPIITK
jgi:hypothetical protein